MSKQQRCPSVLWIAAQLALLCGFQVIAIVISFGIWAAIAPSGFAFVATVYGSPIAIAAGIICALAVGRRMPR
jgi:hypothetical protein